MIGLVFSTEEEAAPFLSRYQRGRFEGLAEGEISHDDQVLVALTGTGKIKATLRTERMLRAHRVHRLLHPGTGTALADALETGALVAASQVFEGDRVTLARPTYPRMPLDVPFEALPTVTLVTQDHTVQGQEEHTYWQRIADVSDMSGYAVAYVAATHGVPCHIVKVITGRFGGEDPDFRKTLAGACDALATFLIEEMDALLQDGGR
ncbi:MAG: 5'-methylthioadenosine nucleosidase [Rhodothermales bacterium]|nr:5'-methylthioadenosine nucleosidase [Rhodothermales bacterium]